MTAYDENDYFFSFEFLCRAGFRWVGCMSFGAGDADAWNLPDIFRDGCLGGGQGVAYLPGGVYLPTVSCSMYHWLRLHVSYVCVDVCNTYKYNMPVLMGGSTLLFHDIYSLLLRWTCFPHYFLYDVCPTNSCTIFWGQACWCFVLSAKSAWFLILRLTRVA